MPAEAISQFRALAAFIGEVPNQQRKRLRVARYAERAGVDRLKSDVVDELGCQLFRSSIVAAVEETWTLGPPAVLEHIK
jgi:hypothetical protein